MIHLTVDLTEQEADIIISALSIAIDNADEYDKAEYEEVLYDFQKKLDEDHGDELE